MRNQMTPDERDLFLEIIDGEPRVTALVHHWHLTFPRWMQALQWLRRNRITGKKFLNWMQIEHEGSPLKAYSYILKKIDHAPEIKTITIGKDFLL